MMKTRSLTSTLLFTIVALAAFSVWTFGSRAFSSEAALYSVCALVFLGFGGLSFVPSSGFATRSDITRFCLRFSAGFVAFSFIWSGLWFTFRDTFGEIAGSFFGFLALLAILRSGAVEKHAGLLLPTAIVFLWYNLGYYTGGLTYKVLQDRGPLGISLPFSPSTIVMLARLSWGLFFGLGLGYGLSSVLQRSRQS